MRAFPPYAHLDLFQDSNNEDICFRVSEAHQNTW
jgi:hypothetical protein